MHINRAPPPTVKNGSCFRTFTHAFDKRARGAVRASKIGSTRQVTLRALARATHWW
jgi:hypothetical protein